MVLVPPLSRELVAALPKVLLHDHLDGGLRPATLLELARECGYDQLPASSVSELAAWFHQGEACSLPRYLGAFEHTLALMQSASALTRVARECVEDLAADGVVYAEIRFAPELHLRDGLALSEVLDAVRSGVELACSSLPIKVGLILTAMRERDATEEVVELALASLDAGVVGVDLAGPEKGFPVSAHQAALTRFAQAGGSLTLHAGEGFGLPSIKEALDAGAQRLGHGVRIVEDISLSDSGEPVLGPLATRVRDERIPLELCPSSNIHTGLVASLAAHPAALLYQLGFALTINTDNRLMSGVSLSDELFELALALGWGISELRELTLTALDAAFLDAPERTSLLEGVIRPRLALLGL